MARLALRMAGRAGLRWLVVAAAGRFVLRRLRRSAVDRAAAELEAKAHERLPAPVARAVSSLPPAVRQAGGSAVVAGRTARGAMQGGRRAGRALGAGREAVATIRRPLRPGGPGAELAARIQAETDVNTRLLRSRYLAATGDAEGATDALLDTRQQPAVELVEPDPHDAVDPPVARGRRRPRRPAPSPRRHRSYRPPRKPWD
ncbi:MAG: hypothetical protein R2761_12140 [Acidimicrobiales bacterium]